MSMSGNFRIVCLIPTYNGHRELKSLLASLQSQTARFDLMAIDSSSSDGTFDLLRAHLAHAEQISSEEFNHGGTRQRMADKYPEHEIYVYLTQDAVLIDPDAIAKIVAPFEDPRVGAVCGRQLPHFDANPLAQHARYFNYPRESQVKSLSDASVLGIKTAFMSNSFAAYRASALKEIGGFPSHVIFGEDMYVAAKMLLSGWKVAYAGNAECRHSHNYTFIEEFRRYFDMGVFHAREPWIRRAFGNAGKEGVRYIRSEIKFLGLSRFYLFPSALLRNFLKLFAYKLGQQEVKIPLKLKRKIGMHRNFWNGPFSAGGAKVFEQK